MEDTKRRTEDEDLDSRYWTKDSIYAEVPEIPGLKALILFYANVDNIQASDVDSDYLNYIEKVGDSAKVVSKKNGVPYPLLCDKTITVEWTKTLIDAVLEIKRLLIEKHSTIYKWKAFAGNIKYDQEAQAFTLIYGLEPKGAV